MSSWACVPTSRIVWSQSGGCAAGPVGQGVATLASAREFSPEMADRIRRLAAVDLTVEGAIVERWIHSTVRVH